MILERLFKDKTIFAKKTKTCFAFDVLLPHVNGGVFQGLHDNDRTTVNADAAMRIHLSSIKAGIKRLTKMLNSATLLTDVFCFLQKFDVNIALVYFYFQVNYMIMIDVTHISNFGVLSNLGV